MCVLLCLDCLTKNIANAEFVEVVADDLDPFVNEIHNFVAPK